MGDTLTSDGDLERAIPQLSNWGRWGSDDQLGTLNFITPATRAAAAGEVRSGVTVSLARVVQLADGTIERGAHEITRRPTGGARDFVAMVFHGFSMTHIDALCHVSDTREIYNGHPDETTNAGYDKGDVSAMAGGIVGRGVLLDIAALRGAALDAGDAISLYELEQAAANAGVALAPGDILWVRTGRGTGNTRDGRAGLNADCLAWIRERQVAVVGSDGDNDAWPSTLDEWASPMHSIGIWKLGLALIDNADLDPLAETCQRLGRWSFMCTILPLPLRGATGSPVNPLAVF